MSTDAADAQDLARARLRYIDQGSAEWAALTKGAGSLFEITASAAPDIVGVGYRSPHARWKMDYFKQKPLENPRTEEMMAKGREDEPSVVARFEQWYHENVEAPMWIDTTGTWAHPKHPWLGASPDRRLYFPKSQTMAILEVKARQENSIPEPPNDNYYIQMQVQLACAPEAQLCYFASANIRNEYVEPGLVVCAVRRDEELFEHVILPRLNLHRSRVKSGFAPPERQGKKVDLSASKAAHIIQLYP